MFVIKEVANCGPPISNVDKIQTMSTTIHEHDNTFDLSRL